LLQTLVTYDRTFLSDRDVVEGSNRDVRTPAVPIASCLPIRFFSGSPPALAVTRVAPRRWSSRAGGGRKLLTTPPPSDSGAGPTAAYPADLAGDVVTREGTTFHLRPIRPDDAPGLIEFHRSLSPRSVYRRFFFVHPTLSPAELERFTCVDYHHRLALVAVSGDRLVAVARYEGSAGSPEAEVAFVVADDHQHQGIASLLLQRLADAARDRGITTFVASTLAENRAMRDVFAHSGFTVTTTLEQGVLSLSFPIGRRPTTHI
jgi:GNAT superfamily N-acetyltransferase